ncbi:MAG: hypothetical protein PHN78_02250 [Dehalococcoidales bacterium]|nr:hypothetical protein [Dehalococcoidales bacterium]
MRRGCISLGGIKCNKCRRIIPEGECYLAIDEKSGAEVDKGKTMRYCVKCALHKGYAHEVEEKGEKILTFFPKEL